MNKHNVPERINLPNGYFIEWRGVQNQSWLMHEYDGGIREIAKFGYSPENPVLTDFAAAMVPDVLPCDKHKHVSEKIVLRLPGGYYFSTVPDNPYHLWLRSPDGYYLTQLQDSTATAMSLRMEFEMEEAHPIQPVSAEAEMIAAKHADLWMHGWYNSCEGKAREELYEAFKDAISEAASTIALHAAKLEGARLALAAALNNSDFYGSDVRKAIRSLSAETIINESK